MARASLPPVGTRVRLLGDHPHAGEYGTVTRHVATQMSGLAADVRLENCPHGTRACGVFSGDHVEVVAPPPPQVPLMCAKCVERHIAGAIYDVLERATVTGEYQPRYRDHEYRLCRDAREEARCYVAVNIRSWHEPHGGA